MTDGASDDDELACVENVTSDRKTFRDFNKLMKRSTKTDLSAECVSSSKPPLTYLLTYLLTYRCSTESFTFS